MSRFILILMIILFPFPNFAAILDVTSGPTTGNTIINITAEASEVFGIPATVTIGGRSAQVETSASGIIEVKTPEGVGKNLEVVIMSSTGSIIANNAFSYDSPILSSISPDEVFTRGGEIATLLGSNFGTQAIELAEVIVGGNPATVISQTHGEITFRIPIGSGVDQNVRVRVGNQSSNILQIDYFPPSIWKVEPKEVTPGPGDTIYITGVNFGNGFELPDVRVGNVACQEVIFGGDDQIFAVTGIGDPAGLDVVVSVGGQQSNSYPLKNKKPIIYSVSDVVWNPEGGEEVTFFGQNAGQNLANMSLDVNGKTLPIIANNGLQFTFNTIAGCGQNLPLTLTVNGVKSDPILISYEQSVLSNITPSNGSTFGFGTVSITGAGIGAGEVLPNILFGSVEASNVEAVSDDVLTCTIPEGVGQKSVSLELNGVTSNTLTFTYNAPNLIGVTPFSIPLTGGEVVISGLELGNDVEDVEVVADGIELQPKSVTFAAVVVDVPAGYGIGKEIKARVGGVLSNTLNYQYATPSISGISPSSGLAGQVLVISGSNLGGNGIPTQVKIDGNPAGILTSSKNEIKCIIPAGSGIEKEVEVSFGNASDTFLGFNYGNPPPNEDKTVEVVGQLRITDLPFKNSNGVLLGVDSQGNLLRNTSPQISVSLTNDTLFIGANQFLVIPGISKANGGN